MLCNLKLSIEFQCQIVFHSVKLVLCCNILYSNHTQLLGLSVYGLSEFPSRYIFPHSPNKQVMGFSLSLACAQFGSPRKQIDQKEKERR
jgi:hypothetical protein